MVNDGRCNYNGSVYMSGELIPEVSGKSGCSCNSEGKIVCQSDTVNTSGISPQEFTAKNLVFDYSGLNKLDSSSFISNVAFVDISQRDSLLKIVLERKTMCNEDGLAAPQVGFYKEDGSKLILTVNTNLLENTFSIPCVTENIFNISGLNTQYPDDYKVYYQDELDTLLPANNCVYEGSLKNNGDVYQSLDGCSLCSCANGSNRCEYEDSCLE